MAQACAEFPGQLIATMAPLKAGASVPCNQRVTSKSMGSELFILTSMVSTAKAAAIATMLARAAPARRRRTGAAEVCALAADSAAVLSS